MKIAALAGGVGGAKLAEGLARLLPPMDFSVIVNTADDFEHFGLHISPDLDTVCYTLAGMANRRLGWGRARESWLAMQSVEKLGGPAWFRLGDRDLGTHLERTRRLKQGESLSDITRIFCKSWGIRHTILPMTNESVATIVQTDEGELEFQDYFVNRRCRPRVRGFTFRGASRAKPAPGAAEVLSGADRIIICPSNPWVSIAPILAVPGLRELIPRGKTIAVSPIVGGRALKGPAAKMYAEMGIEPSALAVAAQYHDLAGILVISSGDAGLAASIDELGVKARLANIVMRTLQDRRRLAQVVLDFAQVDMK